MVFVNPFFTSDSEEPYPTPEQIFAHCGSPPFARTLIRYTGHSRPPIAIWRSTINCECDLVTKTKACQSQRKESETSLFGDFDAEQGTTQRDSGTSAQ